MFYCRAAPCTCRGRSRSKIKSGIPWDGGAVWVVRTRRKPIHGGSMAPSMATTVLPTHTAPPLTDSARCWWVPTVGRHICQISIVKIGSDPCRPTVGTHHQQQVPTDRGNLSKAGWVRLRGCERHGWRDQAPMDGFTAPPSTGPPPPTHGKPAFDVDVASAGAGRSPAENSTLSRRPGCRPVPVPGRASGAPCAGKTGCSAAAAPCPRGRRRSPAGWCRSG